MKSRVRYSAEFKTKIAIEVNRVSELAMKHELHPDQITQWKRQAIEKLARVFDDKAADAQAGRESHEAANHDRPAHRRAGFFG